MLQLFHVFLILQRLSNRQVMGYSLVHLYAKIIIVWHNLAKLLYE